MGLPCFRSLTRTLGRFASSWASGAPLLGDPGCPLPRGEGLHRVGPLYQGAPAPQPVALPTGLGRGGTPVETSHHSSSRYSWPTILCRPLRYSCWREAAFWALPCFLPALRSFGRAKSPLRETGAVNALQLGPPFTHWPTPSRQFPPAAVQRLMGSRGTLPKGPQPRGAVALPLALPMEGRQSIAGNLMPTSGQTCF